MGLQYYLLLRKLIRVLKGYSCICGPELRKISIGIFSIKKPSHTIFLCFSMPDKEKIPFFIRHLEVNGYSCQIITGTALFYVCGNEKFRRKNEDNLLLMYKG